MPIPSPERFGPSALIEAGDQRLLVDAGRGATIRLYQLNMPISAIDPLLLTHYHSDHTSGVPDLWLTGWLPSDWRTPQDRLPRHWTYRRGYPDVALEQAYAADINIRVVDEKLSLEALRFPCPNLTATAWSTKRRRQGHRVRSRPRRHDQAGFGYASNLVGARR